MCFANMFEVSIMPSYQQQSCNLYSASWFAQTCVDVIKGSSCPNLAR